MVTCFGDTRAESKKPHCFAEKCTTSGGSNYLVDFWNMAAKIFVPEKEVLDSMFVRDALVLENYGEDKATSTTTYNCNIWCHSIELGISMAGAGNSQLRDQQELI